MYSILKDLQQANISTTQSVSATNYSTYRGGGILQYVATPKSIADICKIYYILQQYGAKSTILGAGSNTLISDNGYNGLVVHTGAFSDFNCSKSLLTVYSGAKIPKLANFCKSVGLSGLENLCGIPASLGGAITMNAGAYGTNIADLVKCVTVMDTATQQISTIRVQDIPWEYRSTCGIFNKSIILSATLLLTPSTTLAVTQAMAIVQAKRQKSQPNSPSLGSTFKRIANNSAGYYIEQCGLKGYAIGGAMVSPKHAGFIINNNNGTASDYLALCDICKTAVKHKFQLDLQKEVIFLQ